MTCVKLDIKTTYMYDNYENIRYEFLHFFPCSKEDKECDYQLQHHIVCYMYVTKKFYAFKHST